MIRIDLFILIRVDQSIPEVTDGLFAFLNGDICQGFVEAALHFEDCTNWSGHTRLNEDVIYQSVDSPCNMHALDGPLGIGETRGFSFRAR